MTVLIGFRCKDVAVLACDSQETRVNYSRFWHKVNWVDDNFVVLGAGALTLSKALACRLRDKLQEERKADPIKQDKMIRVVEQILLTLAQEIGEVGVKERQFLIAGITDKGEKCLWAVDSGEIYLREIRTWECYGSGIDAAEMLMENFYFPEITAKEAIPLLIYMVHSVSEIFLDCGGPVLVIVVGDEASTLLFRWLPFKIAKECLEAIEEATKKGYLHLGCLLPAVKREHRPQHNQSATCPRGDRGTMDGEAFYLR